MRRADHYESKANRPVDTDAEAECMYALLTDGGKIFMKMEKTFFASRFAMLRDKEIGTHGLTGGPVRSPMMFHLSVCKDRSSARRRHRRARRVRYRGSLTETTMRLAVCTAVLVLAAAGVASAQTVSKSPEANPACSLLTKEDAAAALGEAVKGPDATAVQGGPSSCDYTGSGLHRVQLTVMPMKAAEAAVYAGLCAQKTKEGLTGLGDVACWYNTKHTELQVLKGLTVLSIELSKSGDPTEAIKAVARKVYAKVK